VLTQNNQKRESTSKFRQKRENTIKFPETDLDKAVEAILLGLGSAHDLKILLEFVRWGDRCLKPKSLSLKFLQRGLKATEKLELG